MSEAEEKASDVFDVERIRSLVELMKEFDLREIDLKASKHCIRLTRGADTVANLPPPVAAPPTPGANVPAALESAAAPTEETGDPPHVVVIKSPMVGTFYGRSNPSADPYVRVGDVVTPETTVCVIEAMKVFNEIPAEVNGRVVAILAEDEDPVEFGKPLFKVDTSGA
jgi:acetyl-CoA carboxylase biotin carboxyl carrier protein